MIGIFHQFLFHDLLAYFEGTKYLFVFLEEIKTALSVNKVKNEFYLTLPKAKRTAVPSFPSIDLSLTELRFFIIEKNILTLIKV